MSGFGITLRLLFSAPMYPPPPTPQPAEMSMQDLPPSQPDSTGIATLSVTSTSDSATAPSTGDVDTGIHHGTRGTGISAVEEMRPDVTSSKAKTIEA